MTILNGFRDFRRAVGPRTVEHGRVKFITKHQKRPMDEFFRKDKLIAYLRNLHVFKDPALPFKVFRLLRFPHSSHFRRSENRLILQRFFERLRT